MPLVARLLAFTCLLVLMASCGAGGGAGADGDPASLVPQDAELYFEGQVKPEGDRKRDVLAAAGKLLRTPDPERRLRELFDEAVERSGKDFDYDRDIKPWLGERAGVYATELDAAKPKTIVIAATTDEDKAADALDSAIGRVAADREPRERTYEDVKYQVGNDGVAAGIVDGFLVIGEVSELRRVVDTVDGKSLAESDTFQDTLDGLSSERLATGYLDVKSVLDTAAKADPETAGQLEPFTGPLDLDRVAPLGLAFLADGERLAVESAQSTKGASRVYQQLALLVSGAPTPLVGDLPGDAWGAYGVAKLGQTAKALYEAFAGGLGGAVIAGQIRQQTGLDLQEDVFAWIGDTAIFVRGADQDRLEGALVIQATDPARARRAVTKLVGVAGQQASLPFRPTRLEGAELAFSAPGVGARGLYVAVGNGRAVLALGEAAARDGLDASGVPLRETEGFERAEDAVGPGLEPASYLDMPALLGVIESSGGGADAGYARAKPYLETLAAATSGAKKDGERLRSRFTVALK
jgi:hypothetical protein